MVFVVLFARRKSRKGVIVDLVICCALCQEKKLEWGTGLAQKREAEIKQRELEIEKEKPFARSR